MRVSHREGLLVAAAKTESGGADCGRSFRFLQAKESWDMESAEKLEAAGKRKEEGNALYKLGKYDRASKKYAKVRRGEV